MPELYQKFRLFQLNGKLSKPPHWTRPRSGLAGCSFL
jgi:hypothetical protein